MFASSSEIQLSSSEELSPDLYALASLVHASMSRPGSNMTSTMNVLGHTATVTSAADDTTGSCQCCNPTTQVHWSHLITLLSVLQL